MSKRSLTEKEGTLDDFIDSLVSAKPQPSKSIKLEVIDTETDTEMVAKILVEIFSKMMKYLFGDRNGVVDLDAMGQEETELVSKYFQSFGFEFFVEKREGYHRNKTSFGDTETRPISSNDLRAQCLKIQTKNNFYLFYWDVLK